MLKVAKKLWETEKRGTTLLPVEGQPQGTSTDKARKNSPNPAHPRPADEAWF